MMKLIQGISALFLCLALSGCEPVQKMLELLELVKPATPGKVTQPESIQNELGASPTPTPILDPVAKAESIAKQNSELLAEIYKVVFNEDEVEDKSDYGSLVNSLNQGASLEGIYRGLVMGSRYRALESKAQGASPAELKFFAIEMAELQSAMRQPTQFSETEAKKPPSIDYPDGSLATPTAGAATVTKKRDKAEIMAGLLKTFIGASVYTLKRTLGDEALRKFDEDKDDIGNLARWYASTVVRLSQSKVDFGLELRNRADFDFHFRFAKNMAVDRVKWEALNRYHRYLNAVSKSR
jgi:hypothetical protein